MNLDHNSTVVKLTKQCSNVILHKLSEKKDPVCPTISCSIRAQQFDQALYDLGASVSVMPNDVFDKLNFTLADSSVRYPAGIAEDVPVKIRDFFIPFDFVVLDMDTGKETPLILGRPFLSTVGANIDVGTGSIWFHINRKEEKFEFQPRTEHLSMVRIKYRPNPQNIQVVEVEPPKTDSLVKFMQNFLEKEIVIPINRYWKTPVKASKPVKKLEQPA
uniref:Athila ORF 1, putative n=1 Tax=Oryza sativa subsp. japonica TaxID=39947 RepID=Q2QPP7_ORYSJ|nr:Athila ORF 1, putative [Oryza sativa Japonica Group]